LRTPALVLGSDYFTTLEVIRILGRRGIPQFAVGTGRSAVSQSRWHRRLPSRPSEDHAPSSLPRFLAGLDVERLVLIPCTDDWVLAVARLEPALASRFPASLAPRESLEVLLDKGRFAELAQRLGVPHPRTIRVASDDDVAGLPESAFRDAFLKPCYSQGFRRRYGVKAVRVETRERAVALVREARKAGLALLLQEYIPGPAARHYFVNGFMDRDGTIRAWSISQRLRGPSEFSDGSLGVCVRLEDVAPAVEIVQRFVGALPYRGVFDAEFKYDERDGLFKILEINTRPYGNIGFAARCGVDFVSMAYRDALDLPVESPAKYTPGRYYFNAYADLVDGWRMAADRPLWIRVRSWFSAYHPVFCWDDPLPAMVVFLTRSRARVRGWVGRLLGRGRRRRQPRS
jgi:D-aspartate ligase